MHYINHGAGILERRKGVEPQLYADNLKCVSRDPGVLLRAARFTAGYVRLVGHEPAPSKCVLMSTSRAVRSDIRRWVVTDEVDRWSVKLDVWYHGRGILILLFGVGLLPWLLGFVSLLLGWCLSLLFLWTFMGGSGSSVPCLFLVLCMVSRILFLLRPVCVSCGLLLSGLFGLAVSLLPILARCLVVWLRPCVLRCVVSVPYVPLVPCLPAGCSSQGLSALGWSMLMGALVMHGGAHLLVESAAEIGFI